MPKGCGKEMLRERADESAFQIGEKIRDILKGG